MRPTSTWLVVSSTSREVVAALAEAALALMAALGTNPASPPTPSPPFSLRSDSVRVSSGTTTLLSGSTVVAVLRLTSSSTSTLTVT